MALACDVCKEIARRFDGEFIDKRIGAEHRERQLCETCASMVRLKLVQLEREAREAKRAS